jgi:hypothetical protein
VSCREGVKRRWISPPNQKTAPRSRTIIPNPSAVEPDTELYEIEDVSPTQQNVLVRRHWGWFSGPTSGLEGTAIPFGVQFPLLELVPKRPLGRLKSLIPRSFSR